MREKIMSTKGPERPERRKTAAFRNSVLPFTEQSGRNYGIGEKPAGRGTLRVVSCLSWTKP